MHDESYGQSQTFPLTTLPSRNLHFNNHDFLSHIILKKCQNPLEAVEPKRSSRHEVAVEEHKQNVTRFYAQNAKEMKLVTKSIKLPRLSNELHVRGKNDFENRGSRMRRGDEGEGEVDSWVMGVSSMRVVGR